MELGDQIEEKVRRLVSNAVYYKPHSLIYQLTHFTVSDMAWNIIRNPIEGSTEIWEEVETTIQTYVGDLIWI